MFDFLYEGIYAQNMSAFSPLQEPCPVSPRCAWHGWCLNVRDVHICTRRLPEMDFLTVSLVGWILNTTSLILNVVNTSTKIADLGPISLDQSNDRKHIADQWAICAANVDITWNGQGGLWWGNGFWGRLAGRMNGLPRHEWMLVRVTTRGCWCSCSGQADLVRNVSSRRLSVQSSVIQWYC